MILTKIMVEALNRILGDYIENLDSKQLGIAVWKGDIVFRNLILKQTSLDALNLPLQAVFGHIDSLTLKLPWKDPFNLPIEASADQFFLLAKPIKEIKYDPVKEAVIKLAAKQAELQRVDQAKIKEVEKDKPKDFSFIEKLCSHLIKNTQIVIKNLHVRYEDDETNPERPFAAGLTLASLVIVTTDKDWVPGIVAGISSIFKILKLEGLAFYLNCGSPSYVKLSKEERLLRFQKEIATKNTQPEECQYVLCPINASVHLTITQKPELENPAFSLPKLEVKMEIEKLGISISKSQYQDILAICDSMDRMDRGLPFRKYRPSVPFAGHAQEWWQFAYVCVLERDVMRKKNNWNWQHMLRHRQKCKAYGVLYELKLQSRKVGSENEQKLNELELDLDLVNLVIIRRKVELEIKRSTPLEATGGFWTLNYWRSGPKLKSADLEEAMSPEEKEQLYKAIDYQENSAQVEYPHEFVDITCKFILQEFEIDIKDDELEIPLVVAAKLSNVQCNLDMRSAASAMKVDLTVDQLSVDGYAQDMETPKLISSGVAGERGLLSILYETNPIDKKCGIRIHVQSKPLKIIYDALTVINASNIFIVPEESTAVDPLTQATANSINNVKQMTTTGLQNAIEEHTSIEMNIDLRAPYIILPYGGKYTGNETALVINLGRMKVSTESPSDKTGKKDTKTLSKLIDQSYDKFNIDFTNLEIVLAQSGENWEKCIGLSKESNLHILHPLTLHVNLHKCLILDDPRLPLIKVRVKLPKISLTVVNIKLVLLMSLINSIPFPKSEEHIPERTLDKDITVVFSDLETLNHTVVEVHRKSSTVPEKIVQITNMDVHFVGDELLIILMDQEFSYSQSVKVSSFTAKSLEMQVIQQTFNTNATVKLKSIGMSQFIPQEIHLLHANKYSQQDQYLINVEFTQVDKKSPEFKSKYQSCESYLTAHFATLDIIFHLEALQSLMSYANDLQAQIEEIKESSVKQSDKLSNRSYQLARTISTLGESFVEEVTKIEKKSPQNPAFKDIIIFQLYTRLDQFTIKLKCNANEIASIRIEGINVNITMKHDSTLIEAILVNLTVLDLNKDSIYYKMLNVLDDEALNAQVVIYNLDEHSDPESIDTSVKVKIGQMKIVFLNWFIANILDFLDKFQTAEQKIIEASQEAAKIAKHNVQEAYTKATRISLDIDIKAPNIVVPANSKSSDAILLVLGHITLQNTFTDMNILNEFNQTAVVDDITLRLMNFKVARIKVNTLNMDNIIQKEETLLKPFTFVLYVKRNLSNTWYRDVPDVDVILKVQDIVLTICQADYKILMGVLSGNLAEGQPKEAPRKVAEPAQPPPIKKSASDITLDMLIVDNEEVKESVYVFLKFSFTMEKFVINIALSSLDDGLGNFYLEGLSVKGRMLTDNSIVSSILLINCIIEDTRKERAGQLSRLMEHKVDTEYGSDSSTSSEMYSNAKSMIDINFQQNGSNTFVDLKVSSFNLILSMDFLMTFSNFFANAIPTEAGQQKLVDVATSIKSMPSISITSTSSKAQPTNITLNLKIEQPEIVLVEHMNHIDTNALILNSEIIMKIRISDAQMVLSGTVKGFELYTCCYNPMKRADTKGPVLHPINISIAGTTPNDAGLHLEVYISEVKLSVSPVTLELLNRCHVTMVGNSAESESTEKTVDYSDLWIHKPFKMENYWFFHPELGEEAFDFSSGDITVLTAELPKLNEICTLQMPSLIITIETGFGNKTTPMLFLESSFEARVQNWSTQISVEATLQLQMGYYNNRLALWEPLIEPTQTEKDGATIFKPWELKLEVSMTEDASGPAIDSESQINSSSMYIDITTTSSLEMTITKTCLDVFNTLGKAFASAMQLEQLTKKELSFCTLKNVCGLTVTLLLSKDNFTLTGKHSKANVVLESGTEVNLQLTEQQQTIRRAMLISGTELDVLNKSEEYYIHVLVEEFNCELELPIVKADTRYYSLKTPANDMGIVCEIEVIAGVRIILLRSIIQIRNEFNIPVDAYYTTNEGNNLEFIATLEPHTLFNMPFKSVYTFTSEIFFSVHGFSFTNNPYVWKDLQSTVTVTNLLYCTSKNRHMCLEPFIIKAVGSIREVYFENTAKYTMVSTCYYIKLRPAVVFKNCLPVDVICLFETSVDEYTVKPGESLPLPNIDPGKSELVLRIPSYLEREWSCILDVSDNPLPFSVWTFDSHECGSKISLDLGLNVFKKHDSIILSLYCPFWMINKTGFLVAYRKSKKTEKHEAKGCYAKNSDDHLNVLHHPASFKGPILFSFNEKNFFGKKKASIRIEQGDWSDRFSIDVAGSAGMVVCSYNNTIYQIGVHNQLTYNGLTKQVTFTPYFIILNNSLFSIECQEPDRPADPWTSVEKNACTSLWPKSEQEDKLLKLRIADTDEISPAFLITESHTTLLKLNNPVGGINVDIQMVEGAIYINFTQYDKGMAPALIFNHTKNSLSFWEKETNKIRKLKPNHRLLYTWENPSGSRVLVWDIGKNNDMEDELQKDGIGHFVPKGNEPIYWISFLNGMQRVLLFTPDRSVAAEAHSAAKFENFQQEISVSIHGIGVSLVNNETRAEIMYLRIASSGVIWEQSKLKSRRFKHMNTKDSINIENTYQLYLTKRIQKKQERGRFLIDAKTEVDFIASVMLRPRKRMIRRTFQSGFWVQMKMSPHQMQLHAKINRIQIDNQLYNCLFPVVLAAVPPPKTVALNANSAHRPFAEVSVVQLLIKNTQIRQFKYFKLLVQEFHIKVDIGFINALLEVVQTDDMTEKEELEQFKNDTNVVNEPLYAHALLQSQQEQKSFYDFLHFSPLKIHISFTLASPGGQDVAAPPNFFNVILHGLGVTLTNLQDVVFKLGYFEKKYSFLTQKQLINEAIQHYVGQSVKQLYVLVFGLDVIGNPYGFVMGITKGFEDFFYEPFQGAIQGPGEFAKGVVLGVKSLFGHTVGGAAGAVSRITCAMGKGVAALTFDKDFQRKRRNQYNVKPATAQEGFARGGKGLVMGVFDGVTGVFTKPISGAKEEGIGGFFKGLGKGAVGLVARPTAGVIDFTSGSLNAVKMATEMGGEPTRIRPSRFCQADGLVRPYNLKEAEGNKILNELEKGKYASTDVYACHYIIVEKKDVFMLTDKRLVYITHNDIFGGWQVEWGITWEEMTTVPTPSAKGICVSANDMNKKKKGVFKSSEGWKIVSIRDPVMQEDVCNKIEELWKKAISL